jgi:carboxyl-terminal processing protease
VYGGGGITPDVKVAVDTTRMSSYIASLIAQGVYAEFIIEYMDRCRSRLKEQYPTFIKFNTDFKLNDEELLGVVEVGKSKNVAFDKEGFEHSRELMRNQLSAMIAQRLFTQSEYFEYINSRENDSFKKAISIAGKWEFDDLTQKIGPK